MAEPTRQYLFSEGQIKAMFAGVTILMVVGLVAVLLLISARPQGRLARADTSTFQRTLGEAAESLSGYRELSDGRVQLDIERAIELVAERGVSQAFTELAGEQAAEQEDAGAVADERGPGEAPPAQGAPEGTPAGLPDGAQVYTPCAGCHQATGQGVPGVFPPLSGHAADLYQADPEYLAEVVLFGLQGPIEVQGAEYDGLMPDWQSLTDEQIAAVLNYLLASWGNEEQIEDDQPYGPEEIAELRALDLSPSEVHERRSELDLD